MTYDIVSFGFLFFSAICSFPTFWKTVFYM